MRHTIFFLALIFSAAAAVDITSSLTGQPAIAWSVLAQASVDAGPPDGTSTSPLVATAPPLTVPPPADAISTPAAALAEAQATYQRSGLWAALLFAAWGLTNALGKRSGPGSLLGDGRWAAGVAGGSATLGAVFDAVFNHAPNGVFVVLTTVMVAAAAVLTPHVTHKPADPPGA